MRGLEFAFTLASLLGLAAGTGSCGSWYPYDATRWATCVEAASTTCQTGRQQSPIDLPTCEVPDHSPIINVNWTGAQEVTVLNNGNTVVATPSVHGEMAIASQTFTLAQCHFHYGSEHTVGGHQFELCTHCVHTRNNPPAGASTHAVLARFFAVGAERNPFFADLLEVIDGLAQAVPRVASLDLAELLLGADMTKYWWYAGSFTTPGCDEVVDWKLLMDLGSLSVDQLSQISTAIGDFGGQGNFRPTQPLNGRQVGGCIESCRRYPYDADAWAECVAGANPVCRSGRQQSPVDFSPCSFPERSPQIVVSWGGIQEVKLFNNGHTVQLEPTARQPLTVVEGVAYTLLQCHFHHGSEHTVGGYQYDMSTHCVHLKDPSKVTSNGRTHAVLGRFFSAGVAANPFLSTFDTRLPERPEGNGITISDFRGPINLDALVSGADMTHYWAYEGSLTTPSCDEVVEWKFLIDVADMSQAQLAAFQTAIGFFNGQGNFRPTQPLYGREITGCGPVCDWYPYDVDRWSTCAFGHTPTCRDGKEQSPIDLPACAQPAAMPEILPSWYTPQTVDLVHNHNTIVLTPRVSLKTSVSGLSHTLVQCHFHYRSEHTVNGAPYDMSAHCVHTKDFANSQRTHMVVAVFFTVGASNTFLASLVDSLPGDGQSATAPQITLGNLFTGLDKTQYWAYEGSLTTPGCQEIVDWKVLMDVAQVSQVQLTQFQTALGFDGYGNFRPTQPLNGRRVQGCVTETSVWYPYDPQKWATRVAGASALCKDGKQQSPIDFPVCHRVAISSQIIVGWVGVQEVSVVNNGHTVVLTPSRDGSMQVNNKAYTLAQCHFHYGSEHTVGGHQFELCTHCVHVKDAPLPGERTHAVLGRFFTVGAADNDFFDHLIHTFSEEGATGRDTEVVTNVDLGKLLDGADMGRYWAYDGSLTTPGCDEIVEWKYLMDLGVISPEQRTAMVREIGDFSGQGNFRPTQPLYGRIVSGCGDDQPCPWYPYDEDAWAECVVGASKTCRDGDQQSPIDFPVCTEVDESPRISVQWGGLQKVTLVNNRHTVQIQPRVDNAIMTVSGVKYTLQQCHFHHGSEHTVGGYRFELGLHCVHLKDPAALYAGDRTHAVLGRFFEVGVSPNPFFSDLKDSLPPQPATGTAAVVVRDLVGPMNLNDLLSGASMSHYWSYDGSLTTPSCDEVVEWKVLTDVGHVARDELKAFEIALGTWQGQGNFRPTQPLNGRIILGCGGVHCNWYPYNAQKWATCVDGASTVCRDGLEQSPVDLPVCTDTAENPRISTTWSFRQQTTVVNNGHTVVVTPGSPGEMMISGTRYRLLQCHFHYGSEHTVGGQQADACVHCVHERQGPPVNGRSHAVLARFFSVGAENGFFSGLVATFGNGQRRLRGLMTSNMSRQLQEEVTSEVPRIANLDLSQLIAGADLTKYWAYDGSLTTPGCDEIVEWRLLMDYGQMSQAQLTALSTEIGDFNGQGNFRPTQPLNGRVVVGCAGVTTTARGPPTDCQPRRWYPYNEADWAFCVKGASETCAIGQEQSPVDLPPCATADQSPLLNINWGGPQPVTLVHNGNTIELRPALSFASLTVGGVSHILQQCHFHYGSEHTVGGKQFDLSIHCVHVKNPLPSVGRTHVVLGRFFTVGHTDNTFLNDIIPDLPPAPAGGQEEVANRITRGIDPEGLLEGASLTHYWWYDGSLTTPGCSEIVEWKFLTDVGELSEGQLVAFQVALGVWRGQGNFRPTQPLNGRIVHGCDAVRCPERSEWYPYDSVLWGSCVAQASPLCHVGMEQSPIDFNPCEAPGRSAWISLDWGGEVRATLVNNHNTVQIKPPNSVAARTVISTVTFTLKQCHFHYGSEHTIGSYRFDMSAHCVHTRDTEHIIGEESHLVLALFYSVGAQDNEFLAKVVDELPAEPPEFVNQVAVALEGSVAVADMFAGVDMSKYWTYNGSFTTPGCDEVVEWKVLMDSAAISSTQVSKFMAAIGSFNGQGNFRPTQPLNGRQVLGCDADATATLTGAAQTRCGSNLWIVFVAVLTAHRLVTPLR